MIVAHQMVVLCLRTIIENPGEKEILAIDRKANVANCAIPEYRFHPEVGCDGTLVLSRYNVTTPWPFGQRSGDVLAGLIAGLGAQGLSPLAASAWGI